MDLRNKRNFAEWAFVVAMVLLCGTLTILQYRWTGEVARAEISQLRESLTRQAGLLCRAFDAELEESCAALVPTSDELDKGTRESVHIAKLRNWKAGNPRPVFKRMAVAIPAGDEIKLLEMKVDSEKLVPMKWPEEWEELRDNLEERLLGPTSPVEHSSGWLTEIPVMRGGFRGGPGGPGGPRGPRHPGEDFGGPREREWVIFELDQEYLREKWLPELISSYLNLRGKPAHDVVVRSGKPPHETIFPIGTKPREGTGTALSIPFNNFGSGLFGMRGGMVEPRWTMEIRYRAGSLEDIVAESRRRNLAVAFVLLALILASGWMLLRATRSSHRLAEERMRFVANVTHELRTPLTVIRGAAHNLKRGVVKDPGGIERYSGLIIEHAEALGAMVEQVLDFSGGKGTAARVALNTGEVLRAAAAVVQADPRCADCRIEIHLPAHLPEITGDGAALQRAFQNLMENAAKHGGGGWVGVTAVVGGRQVRILVSDHGPGIPADEMEEIFKPFFRGGRARASQTRGSGLGLSLVKETAEAHGGSVSANSESGKGSTFTFSLPI